MKATTLAGVPAGTVVFGKNEVRQLSEKQQAFILKLLSERKYDPAMIPLVDGTINVRHASRIIDYLLSCPYISVPMPSDKAVGFLKALMEQRQDPQNRLAGFNLDTANRDEVSAMINYLKSNDYKRITLEVGAYEYNGIVYSVRESQNGNLYAVHWVDGVWSDRDYRIVRSIDPATKLTFAQALRFGTQTGVCVYCHRTLTDAKSVSQGMGDWCYKKHHGGGA